MFSFSSGGFVVSWFSELIEGGGFVVSWFRRRRVNLPGAGSSWFEGGGFGRRRVDRRRVAETTGSIGSWLPTPMFVFIVSCVYFEGVMMCVYVGGFI
ncbi:hypothetical protein Hanom_Chr10g00927151 [Helianthus anomalus]